jgi:hypothetical protein
MDIFQMVGQELVGRTGGLTPVPTGGTLLTALDDPNKRLPDVSDILALPSILSVIGGNGGLSILPANPLAALGTILSAVPRLFQGILAHQVQVAASVGSILKVIVDPAARQAAGQAAETAYGEYFFAGGFKTVDGETISPPGAPSSPEQLRGFFSQQTGERYIRDLIRVGIEGLADSQFELPGRFSQIPARVTNPDANQKAYKWFTGFGNLAEASITAAVEQALQGAGPFQSSPLIAASVATAAGTAGRKAAQDTFLTELGIE